jgi:c(7)-type cytochrome triheme protein
MKNTKFYIFFLIGILTFLSLTAYITFDKDIAKKFNIYKKNKIADNKNIIKFNHGFHIKDVGMQCKDCHDKALTSVKAEDNLNPLMKNCESCHDVKDEKNCNICHFEKNYKKLEATGKNLIFSHKFHLDKGKQCADCHTGLEKVKYASESPTAFPMMESCATCHDKKTATNNCEACHTNLAVLTPKTHLNSNFLNEHKVVNESGKNNCMMCHSDNFCQACHTVGKYSGENTTKNFYAPYYTKESGVRTDRSALQKLTNMHTINYQYTHGIDARQRSFECKTCHSSEDFCTPCHQNNGNTQTGFIPKSHLQPRFTTIGVHSGGGLHSELARRDIESCESCHSIQGGDPTCVKCHFDNNGIKGTHPKTHETGFLSDEKGIWHNTPGAVCYICHTDANAKPNGQRGIGFCGYCHK